MWKRILEIAQALATLTRDIEETRREIKELRKDFTELVVTVSNKLHEMELSNHYESSEREKLTMQLKLDMLEFERRLLPGRVKPTKKHSSDD